MMAASARTGSLIERLPPVRGRIRAGARLGEVTWFRVGGAAEVLFVPADLDDLTLFLRQRPAEVPVTVIGVGSNLLVRDGGIDGVVVRLGRGFAGVRVDGDVVRAGAAALDVNVARTAAAAGIAGMEFLSGVPGTIGGALRMNAGAYGREMVDIVIHARAVDPSGRVHELDRAAIGFGYRRTAVAEDWIFVEAVLGGWRDSPDAVTRRMAEIAAAREVSQPVRSRTGGSTFANPPGAKAWELIDRAGCRGLRVGGAVVSDKHCNFLINTGTASAADIEALGEEVRRRVHQQTGITLEWEIRRVGRPTTPLVRGLA